MQKKDYIFVKKFLEEIARNAYIAKEQIIQKVCSKIFVPSDLNNNENMLALGQYLDGSRENQHGIFGTSAAAAIILNRKEKIDKKNGLLSYLINGRYQEKDNNENTSYEFSLTYKRCSFLRSFSRSDICTEILPKNIWNEFVEFFIESRLNERAWGYYYISSNKKDEDERILPTCFVLDTFHRLERLSEINNYEKSIDWLCGQLLNYEMMAPVQIAIILKTVLNIRPELKKLDNVNRSMKFLRKNIYMSVSCPYSFIDFYVARKPNRPESEWTSEYYTIIPKFELLTYFLNFDNRAISKRIIFLEIEKILSQATTQGAYTTYISLNYRKPVNGTLQLFDFCNDLIINVNKRNLIKIKFWFYFSIFSKLCSPRSILFAAIIVLLISFSKGYVPKQDILISILGGLVGDWSITLFKYLIKDDEK